MTIMIKSYWEQALVLVLLGMGTFFVLAALMALMAWFVVGHWRPFMQEIVLLSMMATIPTAYYLRSRFVAPE